MHDFTPIGFFERDDGSTADLYLSEAEYSKLLRRFEWDTARTHAHIGASRPDWRMIGAAMVGVGYIFVFKREWSYG